MNEKNNFANQFVDLWQENFEKVLASDTNMRQMQQILEGMKAFYAAKQSTNEPSATANSDAYDNGDVAELLRSVSSRLDEFEERLAALERGSK